MEMDVETKFPMHHLARCAAKYAAKGHPEIVRHANGFNIESMGHRTDREALLRNNDWVVVDNSYIINVRFCKYEFRQ